MIPADAGNEGGLHERNARGTADADLPDITAETKQVLVEGAALRVIDALPACRRDKRLPGM